MEPSNLGPLLAQCLPDLEQTQLHFLSALVHSQCSGEMSCKKLLKAMEECRDLLLEVSLIKLEYLPGLHFCAQQSKALMLQFHVRIIECSSWGYYELNDLAHDVSIEPDGSLWLSYEWPLIISTCQHMNAEMIKLIFLQEEDISAAERSKAMAKVSSATSKHLGEAAKMFAQMDKKGDGVLSIDNSLQLLEKLCKDISPEDERYILGQLCYISDGKGHVNQSEFLQAIHAVKLVYPQQVNYPPTPHPLHFSPVYWDGILIDIFRSHSAKCSS